MSTDIECYCLQVDDFRTMAGEKEKVCTVVFKAYLINDNLL